MADDTNATAALRSDAVLIMAFVFLALLILVGAAAVAMGDKDLLHTIGNGVLNVCIGIAGYYFGSSRGSQKKDETLASVIKGAAASDE